MKTSIMSKTVLVIMIFFLISQLSYSQEASTDLKQLVGTWRLDMSPENQKDNNFAMIRIETISENKIIGEFYREGVPIREGRTNTQTGKIYVALVSGDNSGEYNSSFYLENGKIYGTTHSLDKDFLSVWVGEKI